LILWLGHFWNGVDPILDLRNSFLINPIRWLHHSCFFIAGLGWHSGRTRLPALARGPLPWLFLAGSAVALFVRVKLLPLDFAAPLTGAAAWVSVASASLFGWLTLYGSLGACAHLARLGGRAIKYLSDSSYWVYLAHFPIVGLVQADLFLVALPSPVKFLVALAIGLAWSLLTYEACVRRTWIGRWLRGGAPRAHSVPRPAYLDLYGVPGRAMDSKAVFETAGGKRPWQRSRESKGAFFFHSARKRSQESLHPAPPHRLARDHARGESKRIPQSPA
jgi:hypothetical protein